MDEYNDEDEDLVWTCDRCGEPCEENTYPTMVTTLTGQVTKAKDGRVVDVEPQFPIETEQLCYTCYQEKYKNPAENIRYCMSEVANIIEVLEAETENGPEETLDRLNKLVVYLAGEINPRREGE